MTVRVRGNKDARVCVCVFASSLALNLFMFISVSIVCSAYCILIGCLGGAHGVKLLQLYLCVWLCENELFCICVCVCTWPFA